MSEKAKELVSMETQVNTTSTGEHVKHALEGMHLHFPQFKHEQHAPIVNVNEVIEEKLTVGQKVADVVAANMGSWRFIIIQSVLLAAWILYNVVTVILTFLHIVPFDPYPFILLNLALSFQAAFAAPFIMISQNRQAEKDRLTAQNDYVTDCKGEEEVRHIMDHLDHQDALILQIVQNLQDQNKKLEAQHQQILGHLSKIDPKLAQDIISDLEQTK